MGPRRHIDCALTSKCGRNWKEFQPSRCITSLCHCSSYVRHTSTANITAWYQLILWHIVLSFCKMTLPFPGYRIVEEEYGKYKYIELCYFYAGSTYIYIIRMTICLLSNSIISVMHFWYLHNESYSHTLQDDNMYGEWGCGRFFHNAMTSKLGRYW
jgi:hypothetical protein